MRGWREKLLAARDVKVVFTKIYREPVGNLFSEERFAGVAGDGVANVVAQANDFMPVGSIAGGLDRSRECDRYRRGTRENGAVAKKTAGAGERKGNDRKTGGDSSVKGAQLAGAVHRFRNECAIGKDQNGFAGSQDGFHLFHR